MTAGTDRNRIAADVVKQLVEKQAEDNGIWFDAETITEAYLQQQIRLLHAAIEGTDRFGRALATHQPNTSGEPEREGK